MGERSLFVVFTRNWIDLEGNGHGFRYLTTSSYFECAAQRADEYNQHKVAGKSFWEVSELTPAQVMSAAPTDAGGGDDAD